MGKRGRTGRFLSSSNFRPSISDSLPLPFRRKMVPVLHNTVDKLAIL
jgi:hypothetical protein